MLNFANYANYANEYLDHEVDLSIKILDSLNNKIFQFPGVTATIYTSCSLSSINQTNRIFAQYLSGLHIILI